MDTELTTHYGGLTLRSPIIVGACPLTAQASMRVAMASAGAGAIVLPSLFQEEVLQWRKQIGRSLNAEEARLAEAGSFTPSNSVPSDPAGYLKLVADASSQLPIPVIASLNGEAVNQWIDFAGELQQAGAAAIELNFHRAPPDRYVGPREIEDSLDQAVRSLHESISVPLFVKLGSEFTSMSHLAARLRPLAHGLVLFGRSPEVDICLDDLRIRFNWGLTPPGSITQYLGAIMRVHGFCPGISIAATGGISSASDVIKSLLAGADVAMITSAIYREGPDVIRSYLDGLRVFLTRHQIQSVTELCSQRPLAFSTDEQRRDYKEALASRLAADASQARTPSIQGDRYGHPV
jgi:dihydroorotate dehydrogenase (fumarate)